MNELRIKHGIKWKKKNLTSEWGQEGKVNCMFLVLLLWFLHDLNSKCWFPIMLKIKTTPNRISTCPVILYKNVKNNIINFVFRFNKGINEIDSQQET